MQRANLAVTWAIPKRLTLDAILVLGITVFITATPLLPGPAQVGAAAGVVSLAMVAWFERCQAAAPVGVFCVVCLGLALTGVPYSQLVLGVGLLAYAVVIRRVLWLRDVATWVRWGSFGRDVRILTAASGLVAASPSGAGISFSNRTSMTSSRPLCPPRHLGY
jgi:hypothetical protein